ncbi:PAQR family membrane homeostasis protein TrhA [Liquorilactobacillus aquaticus]|uniref:PAQR family membrane homeostasis protein TrhA n=1 Tax=Liquorilactobacillus aquaticus TaxID=392566 RepID=UPI00070F9C1F
MLDKKERLINEIWSGITHGIGLILSIVALILLIVKAANGMETLNLVAFIVYGVSLMILYAASMFFHCLYFTKAQKVFRVLDHCSIFMLIAGTYTPYCLLAIGGVKGIMLLSLIWFLTIAGIVYHILSKGRQQKVETIIYVVMGWLCLLGIKNLLASLGWGGFILLLIGGIMFTLGALVYSIKGVKYAHVYWHLFVILGSVAMFFSIYFYI